VCSKPGRTLRPECRLVAALVFTRGFGLIRRHIGWASLARATGARMRFRSYSCVSCLNRRHMLWAWCSLFTVGFSDLDVRLCSMGVWADVRIW
jgi:hypothetical protein